MLFLLAVVLVSVKYGLGPSFMASVVNVLVFDFFFVPPRFSFSVSDAQYVFTFAVMLVVGLITAKLTTGLTYQAKVANRREQRVKSLYEMSRDLSGALLPEQVAEISQHFVEIEFKAKSTLLLANDDNQLSQIAIDKKSDLQSDLSIAQWAFDNAKQAGNGTDSLPGAPLLYIPLKAPMRTRGILVLDSPSSTRLKSPEQRRLLETFARLLAISLERIHHVCVCGDQLEIKVVCTSWNHSSSSPSFVFTIRTRMHALRARFKIPSCNNNILDIGAGAKGIAVDINMVATSSNNKSHTTTTHVGDDQ